MHFSAHVVCVFLCNLHIGLLVHVDVRVVHIYLRGGEACQLKDI